MNQPLCIFYFLIFTTMSAALVPKPKYWQNNYPAYQQKLCTLDNFIDSHHDYLYCTILDNALRKFHQRILHEVYPIKGIPHPGCTINKLSVEITAHCDESRGQLWPSEFMNESYSIKITNNQIKINAPEIWGVIRALETVVQIVYKTDDQTHVIYQTEIFDQPQFKHRGYLIDTSRHYLSLEEIKKFLDAMAMTKMNVLHWHITDDTSFPYVSKVFPLLSEKGAFDPNILTYTIENINELLNHARLLGIRVIPEFDTPGHTLSWGKGYPHLLTTCENDKRGKIYGPINPASNATYEFMETLYKEIMDVFPETLVHLGGDEVDYTCWKSSQEILNFMNEMGFDDDFRKLEGYYIARLIELIKSIEKRQRHFTPIVWQEIFDDGFRGDNHTVIHVWKTENYTSVMNRSTAAGYQVLLSACWYLNIINYGADWKTYYRCDPTEFGGIEEQKKLVIGGEAAMWGEYVDDTNLFSRSWPRGAAVAERLWSVGRLTVAEFAPRLDELRCRMLKRGWNAEPVVGPGQCPL